MNAAILLIWTGLIFLGAAVLAGIAELGDRRRLRRLQRQRRDEFRAGVRYRAWREASQLGTWRP